MRKLNFRMDPNMATIQHRCRNGGGGGTGGTCPQGFAINKEVPFLFSESPFFLRKKCPQNVVLPKFEMHPTSLPFNDLFAKIIVSMSREQCPVKRGLFLDLVWYVITVSEIVKNS